MLIDIEHVEHFYIICGSTDFRKGKNYTTYQTILPLNFDLSFQKDIAHGDISRTVLEITGGINLNKYIDFTTEILMAIMAFTCLIPLSLHGHYSVMLPQEN